MFENKAYVAYSWNILVHFTVFKVELTMFDKKDFRRYLRTCISEILKTQYEEKRL